MRTGSDLFAALTNFDASYDAASEGSIPVIFLHGFPFDKTMWQPQMDALKVTYPVIALDIRGFGKSTDETSLLSIHLFADDLILFMDSLSIDKAIVCGLSMGGYIALNAQKRFPSRFEALILCDTQCIADTPEGKDKRYNAIKEIETEGSIDIWKETFLKSIFCKYTLENKTKLVEHINKIVAANSPAIITKTLAALAERSETCTTLNKVNIPTLIICGKEDELTPVAQSEFMHSQIKGSVLKIIEQAGHMSNLEQPKQFNKHLFDFLNGLNCAED